jgi:DNA-binding CsgD family transcriptional regulator
MQATEYRGLVVADFEMLRYLAEGITDKEIAQKLGISVSTVNKRVGQILRKTGSNSRTEAVVKALREGLI